MPTAKELGIRKALDNPPAHLTTRRALAPSQGTSPGAREQSSLCATGTPCRPPRPFAASCGLTCNAKAGFEYGPAGLDEASARHSIIHNVSQATANPAALRCRLLGLVTGRCNQLKPTIWEHVATGIAEGLIWLCLTLALFDGGCVWRTWGQICQHHKGHVGDGSQAQAAAACRQDVHWVRAAMVLAELAVVADLWHQHRRHGQYMSSLRCCLPLCPSPFRHFLPTAHASMQAQPEILSATPPTRTPKTQKAKGTRRHCTWWCHGGENPPFRPNVPKRQKATLNTPQCHEKVPRAQGAHQAEPSPRHVLKQLKDASQPQHPDRWGSICPLRTGVIPAHPEALCGPLSSVEVPGSSQHAMCCLAGQLCRGLIGRAATTGQAGWMVSLGVPSSLQRQQLVTIGSRLQQQQGYICAFMGGFARPLTVQKVL